MKNKRRNLSGLNDILAFTFMAIAVVVLLLGVFFGISAEEGRKHERYLACLEVAGTEGPERCHYG